MFHPSWVMHSENKNVFDFRTRTVCQILKRRGRGSGTHWLNYTKTQVWKTGRLEVWKYKTPSVFQTSSLPDFQKVFMNAEHLRQKGNESIILYNKITTADF